jgi:accessory colonization factor AcfC
MADDEKLKPEDFPVHTEEKKIVKNDGETIANASDKKVAEDVAERLNAEEDLREQDRWA